MSLKFFKVTTLPGTLEGDAFYFVQNGSYSESYVTTSAGVAKAIGNSAMITSLAEAAVSAALATAAANPIEIVANIAARDAAIATMGRNQLYLVTDATGDGTVTAGAALYVHNEVAGTTTKIAEYESMDVTLTWAAISGKPSSAPSLIDDAVTKRHEHSNLTQLNKIGESGGKITYDGSLVGADWTTLNW
jgi:hypothetical protein